MKIEVEYMNAKSLTISVGDAIISARRGWSGTITDIDERNVYFKDNNGAVFFIDHQTVVHHLRYGSWKVILRNALIRLKERLLK